MVLFFTHIPFVVNCTFQLNASGVVATTSPPFYNEPHKSHVLCVKAKPGMTYTSWSQHHFVVIGKPKRHVRKALHHGSQQWSSPDEITLLYYCLFASHNMELFFAHIPFVVNSAFQCNASGVVATVATSTQWRSWYTARVR